MDRQTDEQTDGETGQIRCTCCWFQAFPMVVVVPTVMGSPGKRAGKANQ